jgi:hypothetical protein
MDRQARTGDSVLLTGRSQTLLWWLGRGGVKTTENKIHWPHRPNMELDLQSLFGLHPCHLMRPHGPQPNLSTMFQHELVIFYYFNIFYALLKFFVKQWKVRIT